MNAAPLSLVIPELDAMGEAAQLRAEVERLRTVLEGIVSDARMMHARLPTDGKVSRDTAAGGLLLLAGSAMEALE